MNAEPMMPNACSMPCICRTLTKASSVVIFTGVVLLINDDRADRFALVHQVEGIVDLLERHRVGDQIVDVDLALHVPVDDLRHVGAPARAAERRALPDAAR